VRRYEHKCKPDGQKPTNAKFHEGRVALALEIFEQMTLVENKREKHDFPQIRLVVLGHGTVVPVGRRHVKQDSTTRKSTMATTNVHRMTS
jgi:hypothetical protein